MSSGYDAIIIGGGFAGVTAARELSKKGHKVLLLEARNRLGGRTWYDKRLGKKLEMGGTWLHWGQPHIWSEVSRYNLDLVQTKTPEEAYWIADDQLESGTPEELFDLIDSGMKNISTDLFKYIPNPYKPLSVDKIYDIDHLSVGDRMSELNLTKKEYDLVSSLMAAYFNGPFEIAALTQLFRILALSSNDWRLSLEILSGFKLANGTQELIECIANDAKDAEANILLSNAVSRVEKTDEGFRVTTREDKEFSAKAVVTTLPLTLLNSIEFEPSLSPGKKEASSMGPVSRGFKVWARVRNVDKTFMAMAPSHYPLSYFQYEYNCGDGEAILVGFGIDRTALNIDDPVAVEKELRQWLPNVEVIETAGHNFAADEFSKQPQTLLQKNQLKFVKELQSPENGLFLAGSDYAEGWAGFMDGAIESGLKVSRAVDQYIKTL